MKTTPVRGPWYCIRGFLFDRTLQPNRRRNPGGRPTVRGSQAVLRSGPWPSMRDHESLGRVKVLVLRPKFSSQPAQAGDVSFCFSTQSCRLARSRHGRALLECHSKRPGLRGAVGPYSSTLRGLRSSEQLRAYAVFFNVRVAVCAAVFFTCLGMM